MSESDDTDVLLLIPPDFFLVNSSDSDDSLISGGCDKYNKCNFESLIVNDLVSHVNELENRICVIESKNNLLDIPTDPLTGSEFDHYDHSTTVDSNGYLYMQFKKLSSKSQSMFSTENKFGGSTENFKSVHYTPVKQKLISSLPSTPCGEISRHNGGGTLSPRKKTALVIEQMTPSEILSMSHPVFSKTETSNKEVNDGILMYSYSAEGNQKQKNSSLLGEIDQFLHSVKKNPKPPTSTNLSEHNQKEGPCLCRENSSTTPGYGYGLSNSNKLSVRDEENKTKEIAPMEKTNLKPFKELHPEEVDRFFSNDKDISNNVNQHEASNQHKNVYICGDNENSVPDLGYNLKSFSALPIREETIKSKNIAPLGTYSLISEKKGLELSDIDKLLKNMEATQYEIEKKLQFREAHLGTSGINIKENHISSRNKSLAAGDMVGSVPDRQFGVRGILYPQSDTQSNSTLSRDVNNRLENLPVNEEPFTKRNMFVVGTNNLPKETSNAHKIDGANQFATETRHFQKQFSTVQENSKASFARRKLELNGDASVDVDQTFGPKNLYHSAQEGDIEFHSSRNIPQGSTSTNAHSSSNQQLIDTLGVSKESHVQGDYLPSVPDLGFGLRSLFNNDKTFNASNVQKLSHSSSHPQQSHKDKDIKSIECALLSQIEVPNNIGDNASSRNVYESHHTASDTMIQNQHSLHRGSAEEGPTVQKKVDFVVSTGQGDSVSVQQEYGVGPSDLECTKSNLDLQSSFPDSYLAGSLSSGSGNLLSLSELWGKGASTLGLRPREMEANICLKFEEEKYRRQHCEKLIYHLQSRLLEEQQKLAVAIQVDKGKDQAILKLQDGWSRLVQHWKELEEHRHSLAGRLQSEREANQRRESEWIQKVKQVECELSKALDLAQGYKDKFNAAEKERKELLEVHKVEIETRIHKIQEVEKKLDNVNHLNNQLIKEKNEYLEKFNKAEQATQKERKLLIDAQKEIGSLHKNFESCKAEIVALKEEKETIHLKLKEEKGRINILDQQKKSLQSSLEESKRKEKSARDEMKQLSSQMEKMKVELREYYQDQLEIVVQDKLREFQEQLDNAETGLHKELEQREHAITEIASKQVKQISEKHQLEVQLLEEKHTEELQLYKLQLAQAMQQISQLEAKLQVYSSRKSEIVEKLHDVMETQWQEALRIISGNSPLANNGSDHSRLQRGDNASKISTGTWPLPNQKSIELERMIPPSKGFHHVHNKTQDWGPSKEKSAKANMVTSTPQNLPSIFKDAAQFCVPPIHLRDQSAGSSTADESPFCQEGLLTSRMAEQTGKETPITKESAQAVYENELRKYIMMLLNRSPGNPVNVEIATGHQYHNEHEIEDETKIESSHNPVTEVFQFPKWQKILKQDVHCSESNSKQQNIPSVPGHVPTKDGQNMKPPWK